MTTKKFDVCVAVGQYTNAQGEVKKRYKTIGTVMESDNGPFLLLDATVLSMQLFALANKDRRDSVVCSLFDADRDGPGKTARQDAPPDDDIPY